MFKILDCVALALVHDVNDSLLYTKKHTPPLRNCNALHNMYKGLPLMLAADVVPHAEFVAMLSRCVADGNHEVRTLRVERLRRDVGKRLSITSNLSTSLSERSRTHTTATIAASFACAVSVCSRASARCESGRARPPRLDILYEVLVLVRYLEANCHLKYTSNSDGDLTGAPLSAVVYQRRSNNGRAQIRN